MMRFANAGVQRPPPLVIGCSCSHARSTVEAERPGWCVARWCGEESVFGDARGWWRCGGATCRWASALARAKSNTLSRSRAGPRCRLRRGRIISHGYRDLRLQRLAPQHEREGTTGMGARDAHSRSHHMGVRVRLSAHFRGEGFPGVLVIPWRCLCVCTPSLGTEWPECTLKKSERACRASEAAMYQR